MELAMVLGDLRPKGLTIHQRRVTASLLRVDPFSSRLRWASVIRRRRYNVRGPDSLWHLDGHHSLINWCFVIHGKIFYF